MKKTIVITAIGAMVIAGCAKKEAPPPQQTQKEVTQAPPPVPDPQSGIPTIVGDTITTSSGLKYLEINAGQGLTPTAGQMVKVHYTGWTLNGTKFDSSRDRGEPLEWPIAQGRMIKGFDEGIMLMKIGGRRMLIIAPELAWGQRSPTPLIPPGSTVVFDVELISAVDSAAKM